MKHAEITIRVRDVELIQDILEFCWHHRECAAIDGDGEWHKGNPDCTCGYDELIARLDAQ